MDAQKTILSLIKEIEQHNIDYYVHDNPKISDSEYDVLLRELEKLEKLYPDLISEYSPTKRVGSKPTSKFESINCSNDGYFNFNLHQCINNALSNPITAHNSAKNIDENTFYI